MPRAPELSYHELNPVKSLLDMDWSTTPLGPQDHWPAQLTALYNLLKVSSYPMLIAWGNDDIAIYNSAYASILGHKGSQSLGRSFIELWQEVCPAFVPTIQRVKSGQSLSEEDISLIINKNDRLEEIYLTLSMNPIFNKDGVVEGIFGVCHETTRRILHEGRVNTLIDLSHKAMDAACSSRAIEEVKNVLKSNSKSTPFSLIYLHNEKTQTLEICPGLTQLESTFGLPEKIDLKMQVPLPEMTLNHHLADVFIAQQHKVFRTHLLTDLPVTPLGETPQYFIALPITATDDKSHGVLVSGIYPHCEFDINYESFFRFLAKQVALNLNYAAANQRAIEMNEFFNITPDLMCIIGGDDTFKSLSPSWESFGYPIKDLYKFLMHDMIHPEDRERTQEERTKLLNNSNYNSVSFVNRIMHADGSFRWLSWNASTLHGNTYAIARDITAAKFSELKLQQAKEAAEAANASKSNFLANMSHEIRTPMSAILGFAELLKDSRLSERDRQDAISRIDRSGRSLLRVIDDILDLSKIESNKVDVLKVRFSVHEVVAEVTALLRLSAEKNGLKLILSIDPSVPPIAFSDPARIRQVLLNMIGNAIKFTPQGSVHVHVSATEERFLNFEVQDSGIGISFDDQRKLFQHFTQADPSISRRFGGSGLGLLLSKRLCERMGGDLVLVRSEVGAGSCFKAFIEAAPFELRTASESASLEPYRKNAYIEDGLRGKHILVAEDLSDNQVLIRLYLERTGAQVEFASNGQEAIEKAQQGHYDIILMDIQMPTVDGIQATQALRAKGIKVPILALTAHAMPDEISRSLQAGCNAHLTKPIAKADLITNISKFLAH